MDRDANWLIYGANGFTAELIARGAVSRGLRPILAGRDGPRVTALARALDLPAVVSSIAEIGRHLDAVSVVLHGAGPYAETAAPMADACLRAGVHYLDLSGEVPAIEAVAARDAEARRAGVMLMPSVGFDVVATNCLATLVASRVRDPRILRLGIAGLELISRGSARSTVTGFGRPAQVRRDGRLVASPAPLRRAFDYGRGPSPSIGVSWADLVASYYSTGIPNIEAYVEETAMVRILGAVQKAVGWTSSLPGVQPWLDFQATLLPAGPSESDRRRGHATVVAEVEDASGRMAHARLDTPEVYDFTVETSLALVERVRRGDLEVGFQTPARVYGAGLLRTFASVSLREPIDT
jgi:short subunit dehydrogenase-like uncharacterized protein